MRITLAQLCDELRQHTRELCIDSRKVGEGDVFVALSPAVPGEADRSAEYIRMALDKGAWCIVAQADMIKDAKFEIGDKRGHAWLILSDTRAQLGTLAAALSGYFAIRLMLKLIREKSRKHLPQISSHGLADDHRIIETLLFQDLIEPPGLILQAECHLKRIGVSMSRCVPDKDAILAFEVFCLLVKQSAVCRKSRQKDQFRSFI